MKRRTDGRWVKTVTIDSKRIFFYSNAKTERQAEKDIASQLVSYQTKMEKGKTFAEVSEEWEEEHCGKIAHTTYRGYIQHINFSNEFFAGVYIKYITPNSIRALIQKRINLNHASKTVSNQLSVLNMIFTFACIKCYINSNPCQFIRVPNGLRKKKRTIPTENEIAIINNNVDIPFGLFPFFALYSGLRKGELLALTYEDIDFDRKIINVDKSVYFDGNHPHIKKPKTEAGTRKVILLDKLADKLPKNGTGLIFKDEYGGYITHKNYNCLFDNYRKLTGLTSTSHQLRHAFASYILHDNDIDVKTAQELLGHANISTTQNIYTQITEFKLQQTTEKLNKALSYVVKL